MRITSTLYLLLLLLFTGFQSPEEGSVYQVARLKERPVLNAVWDKYPWDRIEPLQLTFYQGEKPEHFPFTEAKIAYDDSAIYVIFRVKDRYVKAVHNKHQDPVWKDSCVEFFFSPGKSTGEGYFNLEMNCGGTMLFDHQTAPRTNKFHLDEKHVDQVETAHTLQEIVDPEIEDPCTWVVEYRIPFDILHGYHTFSDPEPGDVWRANLYKCADETSHPHWITWALVDLPGINFHNSDYFGTLEFQK